MKRPTFFAPGAARARGFRNFAAGLAVSCVLVCGMVIPGALTTAAVTRTLTTAWENLPADVPEPDLPGESVMLTSDGKVIARFAEYDRIPVTLDQISPWVVTALIATEDVRFRQHSGVDVVGLLRAMRQNASSSATQGGSTITQQYVKNIMLLNAELSGDPQLARQATERTLARKLSEGRRAIALERTMTKDEILNRYLNLVSFGFNAFGIEAAARRYFSTSARALTLSQAATLVGLLKAPSALNPVRNPSGAVERRNVVIDRMESNGDISSDIALRARLQPLGLKVSAPRRGCEAAPSGWGTYCDAVLRELDSSDLLGTTDAERAATWTRGGLVIQTPMNTEAQRAARAAARAHVPPNHRATAVVAVVQPGTGDVAALAFSKDFGSGPGKTQLPLGTSPIFGPGSTMKLFTLSRAVSDGIPLTTVLPGGTTYTSPSMANPASGAFHNYNTSPASNVSIVQATTRSLNTAFVQLEERVGVRRVAELAVRMGATAIPLSGKNEVLPDEGSFTLGAREVPVVQMAAAYATVAAGGLACKATLVTSVSGPFGHRAPTQQCDQVLTPAAARAVTWTLEQVTGEGTGTAARLPDRPVAGKTGTAQDVASAWFAGYTPDWATVVAIADPRGPRFPLVNTLGYSRVYGGTIPAAIFVQTMTAIHEGLPPKSMVESLDTEYLLAEEPAANRVVPDVRGLQVGTALAAIADAGLTALPIAASDTAVVSGTVPRPGAQLAQGQPVEIIARG